MVIFSHAVCTPYVSVTFVSVICVACASPPVFSNDIFIFLFWLWPSLNSVYQINRLIEFFILSCYIEPTQAVYCCMLSGRRNLLFQAGQQAAFAEAYEGPGRRTGIYDLGNDGGILHGGATGGTQQESFFSVTLVGISWLFLSGFYEVSSWPCAHACDETYKQMVCVEGKSTIIDCQQAGFAITRVRGCVPMCTSRASRNRQQPRPPCYR